MKASLLRLILPLLSLGSFLLIPLEYSYGQTRFEAEGAYGWITPFGNYSGGWNNPVSVPAMSGGEGSGPGGSNNNCTGGLRGTYTTLADLGLPNGTYNLNFVFYDNNTSVNSSNIWVMVGPEAMNASIPEPPADPGGMLLVNTFIHTGTAVRAPFSSPTYTNIRMSQTDAIFMIICAGGSSNDAIWDYMDITPTYPNLNNPVITPGQTLMINENNCIGAVVGNVSASDGDMPAALDQSFTYSLTAGNIGNAFTINPATGQLRTALSLDYESRTSYTLTIQVSDNGTPARTTSNTVTVNVGNIVDVTNNQPVIANQTLPNINENSDFGTVVGTVAASDPDAGQTLRYTIIGGNTGNAFSFDGTNQLIVSGPLDYETKSTYTLTVEVADNACPTQTRTATITVNLNNMAEVPNGLCTMAPPLGNLVVNGNFEGPVDNTYSEYSNNGSCAAGPGTWGISLPTVCRSSYTPATKGGQAADATGNPTGKYMLIDADDNVSDVWRSKPISVTAGVTYYFSAWIANVNTSYRNPSELNFLIDDVIINGGTKIIANPADHEWSQYFTTWTAPTTRTISLSFLNSNDDGSGSGDDMALDNITFSGSCQFIDQFRTSQLPPAITACGTSAQVLNSMVPPASTTFSWTRNGTAVAGATGPTLTTGSGTAVYGRYVICYTKSGCSNLDTVDVLLCPLPVELVDFTGWKIEQVNIIKWTTSTERNNAYFVIERSMDGIDFTPVGTAPGHGNSSTMLSYIFTDEHPLDGNNYYRLKQLDHDGVFEYSGIIAVMQESKPDLVIYPNPNSGSFSLLLTGSGEAYKMDITDMEGRIVYARWSESLAGKMEIYNLAKGMYIVRTFLQEDVIIKKVVVY